jgi:hypothetical protein
MTTYPPSPFRRKGVTLVPSLRDFPVVEEQRWR